MKSVRAAAMLLVILMITTLLPSCSEDDGAGFIFKMNIENNPKNLDPQMAVDTESIMVIANMMEGLMRTDVNGAVVPAAAESFSMSEDGLVYTFKLKQGREWESIMEDFSAPVRADNFVFAFQRLFDKGTASPHSGKFACVKNGMAVLNGAVSPDTLGVRALDDSTVEFTLEYPYYDFLSLLTRSAAMPCCREFFELSKGKYGMSAEATASNGAFYLKEWNYDPYWDNNYLIMRRNQSYSDNSRVYPYSVNFFITKGATADSDDFASGDIHCFISDRYDEKLFEGCNYTAGQVRTAGLLINTGAEYFGSKQLREALAKSVNRDSYIHDISEQFSAAYGLVPAGVTLQGRSYRDMAPDRPLSVYDVSAARLWAEALTALGVASVDGARITVSENFGGMDAVYDITDQWQSELLFYCGVETVSQVEYESKIKEGDFSIALVEIRADENSPADFLKNFCGNELFKGNARLAADINALKSAESISDCVVKMQEIETEILGEYVFIPICYENEYLVSDKDSADLVYDPIYPTVRFGEAKHYG